MTRTPRFVGVLLALLTALALALAGCSSGGGETANPAPASPSASDGFPKDVSVGEKTVRLTAKPSRIVILGPSLTETAFGVGAGQQVVAVDKLSDYPAEAPVSELDAFKPNAEAIAAQKPDLVLLSDDTNKVADSLQKLQIPTAVLSAPADVDAAYAQFVTIGELTGNSAAAAQLVEDSKAAIAAAVAAAPTEKKRSYYWELDPTYYSATSKTFIGSVLTQFNLSSIADRAKDASGGYPQLSSEFIVDADPDLIFLADSECCQVDAAAVRKRAGWDVTRAVKDEDAIVTVGDSVASRWGPRFVGIAEAASGALQKLG